MPLLYTVIGVVGWQAAIIALRHFGELDAFWFIVIEAISVVASVMALVFGWAASLDWSK